jgi:hypothetical protein
MSLKQACFSTLALIKTVAYFRGPAGIPLSHCKSVAFDAHEFLYVVDSVLKAAVTACLCLIASTSARTFIILGSLEVFTSGTNI